MSSQKNSNSLSLDDKKKLANIANLLERLYQKEDKIFAKYKTKQEGKDD